MSTGPVYVAGLDRSGKTTMSRFLASLPGLAIPGVGSNMWRLFSGRFGDLAVPDNLDACLAAMLEYKHVRYLEPDEAEIRKRFAEGPATYASLFAAFLEQYAIREGKPRWGAQSGLVEQYATSMFDAYPGLRIVHMVRDPRDRFHASITRFPDARGRAGGAAGRWRFSTTHAERHLRRFPEAYVVIRFEDLVSDTERTLRRVCAFVNEPFSSELLDVAAGEDPASTGAGGLDPAHIGRFRDDVPSEEIAFIELMCGPMMRRWGYRADHSLPREIRNPRFWAATVPDQTARMTAWLAQENLQTRLPRYFGRTPGSKMIVGPEWKPRAR